MSFFNNPENNGIKVAILVIVIAICGYFVYNAVHQNSLTGQGSVLTLGGSGTTRLGATTSGTGTTTAPGTAVGTTTGTTTNSGTGGTGCAACITGSTTGVGTATTGTGTASTGTTGDGDPCMLPAPVILTSRAGAAGSPSTVDTTTGGVRNATWQRFSLTNPSACPVKVSKVEFNIVTNDTSGWPPVQNVRLMDMTTGLQFGASLHPETAGKSWTTTAVPFVFSLATSTPPVVIAGGATENFAVMADSQNVEYEDPSTPGVNVHFQLQLWEFYSTNLTGGAASDQTFSLPSLTLGGTGSIPSLKSILVTIIT